MWIALIIGLIIFIILNLILGYDHQLKRWLQVGMNYNLDISGVLSKFVIETASLYHYPKNQMPYGRATGFMEDFFDESSDYYGFTPIRSKDKMELKEYGLLVTSTGLIVKYQTAPNSSPKTGAFKKSPPLTYQTSTVVIPFAGLWWIQKKDTKLIFHYPDGKEIIDLTYYPEFPEKLLEHLEYLMEVGLTRNLYLLSLAEANEKVGISDVDEQIDTINRELEKVKRNLHTNQYEWAATGFAAGEVYGGNLSNHMKDIQLNSITKETNYRLVDNEGGTRATLRRSGHGEAAEYGNNVLDRLFFKNVESTGSGFSNKEAPGQGVNAADRVVNGMKIQTKYLQTPEAAVRSYLNKDYPTDVALEVPPEQYDQVKELMHERNRDVKVVKGKISYRTAQALCKAGTIPSMTMDVLDGIQMSIPGASISFVFVFAQAKWNGMSSAEAAKIGAKTAAQTMMMGTVIYAGSQQFAKTQLSKEIGKIAGKTTVEMAGYAAIGISGVIIYGPSMVDALRGRISPQQLIKNSLISTGALVGGVIGSKFGGPVGAVAGGYVGGIISKNVMEGMLQDDAEEIYELIREEFIEGVVNAHLDEDEFKQMINRTFAHKKFPKMIKDVYQRSRHFDGEEQVERQREYIRDWIIDANLLEIYKGRRKVESTEITDAMRLLNRPSSLHEVQQLAF